jgi:hypothetical protein
VAPKIVEDQEPVCSQDPLYLLETGNLLIDNSKFFNRKMGTILFAEMFLASVNLTLSCYFVCTVYSLFADGFKESSISVEI